MSLRMIDGFDHYNWSQVLRKWSSYISAYIGAPVVGSGNGRFGGGALHQPSPSGVYAQQALFKTLDPQATWTLGVAVKWTGNNNIATLTLMGVYDVNSNQVNVRLNIDNTLSVTRAGTVLGTTSFIASSGVWYSIELKTTIHPTAGNFDLHINGVSRTSGSNVNTRNTANSTANQVGVGWPEQVNTGNLLTITFDDFYACDANGTVNNTFLGDVRIETLYPNAVGATTQFTPTSGTNYGCVNETPMNDDTSYVFGNTVGNIDTYKISTLSSVPQSILATQLNSTARKDSSGNRAVELVLRSGGSNYAGPDNYTSANYATFNRIDETDPATSAPWTPTGLGAVEVGHKLSV